MLLLRLAPQVFYNAGDDQSYFEYANEEAEEAQGSALHDVSEVQTNGAWARFRCAYVHLGGGLCQGCTP